MAPSTVKLLHFILGSYKIMEHSYPAVDIKNRRSGGKLYREIDPLVQEIVEYQTVSLHSSLTDDFSIYGNGGCMEFHASGVENLTL